MSDTSTTTEVTTEATGEEVLPHLRYDDPPGSYTTETYKEALFDGAKLAETPDVFAAMFLNAIVPDLVSNHGVEVEKALPAAEAFARHVYSEATTADV